jgi:hypothetical protein
MLVTVTPAPMAAASQWLHRYERFWSRNLDRLAAYAENQERRAKQRRTKRVRP